MSLPDRYFHTQLLTPDKTDPMVFERCGQVTGAAALAVATIRWPGAADLLDELARRTLIRLSAAGARIARMSDGEEGEEAARLLAEIEWIIERDGRALRSVLALIGGSDKHRQEAQEQIEQIEANLRLVADFVSAPIVSAGQTRAATPVNGAATQVPKRRTRTVPHGIAGMSYAEMRAVARDMARIDSGVGPETMQILADEVWNLSTGEWTVAEVTRILEHEFDLKLRADDVLRLVEGLRKTEYVELTQRSRSEEES
jgi:hypothetical protein